MESEEITGTSHNAATSTAFPTSHIPGSTLPFGTYQSSVELKSRAVKKQRIASDDTFFEVYSIRSKRSKKFPGTLPAGIYKSTPNGQNHYQEYEMNISKRLKTELKKRKNQQRTQYIMMMLGLVMITGFLSWSLVYINELNIKLGSPDASGWVSAT